MYKIKVRKNPCPGRGSHADFLQGLTEAKVEKLKVSARGGPQMQGHPSTNSLPLTCY